MNIAVFSSIVTLFAVWSISAIAYVGIRDGPNAVRLVKARSNGCDDPRALRRS
ncbi:hypothetical protein K6W16_01975 [Burkholderia dolosa]|uniref:Uncharacterized protein n=1 Tax=Burkholderia dolosa TaxID=152500 RepID=A0A892I7Z4_9BURK|nr:MULTISPECIES: hypothetical protein [Burkholderia]AJY11942.1 hypothetical protein AK34_204 [Burkholderia dolosa AU0158]ETP66766.1 hypothetical protein BDSB_02830 [Burkholderia dolosa PC543]MBR8314365.1 hypothetical protein [Burkholderia dolosa]MBR8418579.1 hypothetical protein [Burkholderia dolosa]MBY4655764.1 hypothetical protein [Burkholderia dolosa]